MILQMKTYRGVIDSLGVLNDLDRGKVMVRPPTIFIVCSGVKSVPNGAKVGTAAVS